MTVRNRMAKCFAYTARRKLCDHYYFRVRARLLALVCHCGPRDRIYIWFELFMRGTRWFHVTSTDGLKVIGYVKTHQQIPSLLLAPCVVYLYKIYTHSLGEKRVSSRHYGPLFERERERSRPGAYQIIQ